MWCPEILVTMNLLRERRMGCLDEDNIEYLFLTFGVSGQFLARRVCVCGGGLAVLYCPCHSFHTPDELLCLQMSAPCRLPEETNWMLVTNVTSHPSS